MDQTVKLLFALIAAKKWKARQFDIITAYLNASIDDREVYIALPTGYGKEGVICRLELTLYGLRQAANLWWTKFSEILERLQFKRSQCDPYLYSRGKEKDGSICIIAIYVDDAILATVTDQMSRQVIQEIEKFIKIKDIGTPTRFLGCDITYNKDSGNIGFSQRQYIENVINSENMATATQNTTPIAVGTEGNLPEKTNITTGKANQLTEITGKIG
ncbi:hypothetical protein N7540_005147 [Penicillium herquei]|nr:hypothetical protein N7540_005147 [Penicillium herquei]